MDACQPVKTRVRIRNLVGNRTTTIESPRDRSETFFDLVMLVRKNNRKRDGRPKACVHLTRELIILNFHGPVMEVGDDLPKNNRDIEIFNELGERIYAKEGGAA
jgi:hypothetical protein